jgi:peptidoglycan/LPS O-acetylase OafA/YrhL
MGTGKVVKLLGWGPVHFLGVLSYGIYLLHSRAQPVWNHLVHFRPGPDDFAKHLFATTATGFLVIAFAWICYTAIEVPARRAVRLALEPKPAGVLPAPSI